MNFGCLFPVALEQGHPHNAIVVGPWIYICINYGYEVDKSQAAIFHFNAGIRPCILSQFLGSVIFLDKYGDCILK
jgi:hypothetical protein